MKKIAIILTGLFFWLSENYSQSLSGTWIFNAGNIPITMLLLDNGTGEFQGLPIKYTAKDGNLLIDDGYQPITYSYQLSQTELILSGGGMQVSVTFSRSGATSGNEATVSQSQHNFNSATTGTINQKQENAAGMAGSNSQIQQGSGSGLPGFWEGQQGKIVFYPDGTLLYNGTSYTYSSAGNTISITGTDGSTTFNYTLSGKQLSLSQGTNSANYTKTSSLKPEIVDQQMVGKWCIMSSNYNSYSGGGSSSEECIILNANGTYEYYYSASRSSSYGGTANQDGDRGTWKTDGITISSVSQTSGKTNRYSLVKENAQNGDATIVLGGKKFVTAYNRPGW